MRAPSLLRGYHEEGLLTPPARWPFSYARAPWGELVHPAASPAPGGTAPAAVTAGIPDGAGGVIVLLRDYLQGRSTIRVQRADAAGSSQWGAQGILVTGSASDMDDPVMASDGAGGVVVAWFDATSNSVMSTLLVQRVSAGGAPQWAPGGVQLTTNAVTFNAHPAIVASFGGAIVAWVDGSGYTPSDVYAQRVDANGIPRWPANGLAVCSAGYNQWEPSIVASGNGGAVIAWRDMRSGFQHDLYAKRLNSNGVAQWAPEELLVCADLSDQEAPAMVSDGADGAVVTWSDPRNGTYDLFAQHLTSGGAALWGDGRPVCMAIGDQRNARLVSDGASGAVVAWEDSRNGNLDVCAQRLLASGDTAWTPAVALSMAGGDQGMVAMASDGAAGAVVTWMDPRAGYFPGVYAQRVNSAGAPQWAADGVPVCLDAVAAENPAVVGDGSGGAIVTWLERRTFDLEIYGQRLDAGGLGQWAPEGAGILLDPGVQRTPVQVSDGAGGTIVAWQQKMSGEYKVYLRRYDSAGQPLWPWVSACTAPGLQILPCITGDGAGGAIVAWVDGRAGLADGDIYVQRVSPVGARPWDDAGVALCAAPGLQIQPAITTDGAGGAIVGWMASPWEGDIFARRVDASGTPQWPAAGVSLCSAPGSQVFPDSWVRDVIVSDGAGGAIVAWHDWRAGSYPDVYAQRVSGDGVTLWAGDGTPLCTAADDQRNVVLASDGSGGAILAWEDDRSGITTIYGQRVDPAGNPQWTPNGVTISGTTYTGRNPRMVADGAGGAVVAWTGYGSPTTVADVFAQRINSSGTRTWSPREGGKAMCLAPGTQRDPVLVSDGASGAIVTWTDFRAGESVEQVDLYAQRVLSNGTTSWTYNGVPLCTASDVQTDPVLIADGSHGAIAAWQDRRSGGMDFIHLQRLNATGNTLWNDAPTVEVAAQEGAAQLGLAISRVLPNPVRGEMTVSFTAPHEGAAAFELLDVSGRRLLTMPLEAQGASLRTVRLAVPPDAPPGVYLLRLVQAGQSLSRKVCVLR